MNKLNQLIVESTTSGNAVQGRPELLGITKAVNALIYKDLVAIQKTTQPKATIFGMRYLNVDNSMLFKTPATFGGRYGNRNTITDDLATKTSYAKDDVFKYEGDAYIAIEAVDIATVDGNTLQSKLYHALMLNKVRLASDAADVEYGETMRIEDMNFELDRWAVDVKTRKLKTMATIELIQDLNAAGINGDETVKEMLSIAVSDEINKDIMQKLQTVSIRHTTDVSTPEGILDLTGTSNDPAHSRTVYRIISDMAYKILADTAFDATYVLCTPKVAAMLSSSGWMKQDLGMNELYSGILTNGLKVYVDAVSKFEYAVVGTKQVSTRIENVESITDPTLEAIGSLYYSPYDETDGAGAFHFAIDPLDLNKRVMVMSRYALSVNPYTAPDATQTQIYKGDDWNAMAGKSKYSRFIGVKF